MQKVILYTIGLWAGLGAAPTARAQTLSPDSSAQPSPLSSLRRHYAAAVGYESRLYNGPEYVNYVKRFVVGHQFFESNEPRPTTLEYGGSTYTGVPLRYDLVQDRLVLKPPLGMLDMVLVNENVRRFTLNGHTFVRLVATPDSAATRGALEHTGFYEVLVDGGVQMLALRRKELQTRASAGGLEGEITQKNEFFIQKDHRYYPVSKAGSVLAVFPENKAALRAFIRTKKLKFGDAAREKSLVALLRYYATLPAGAARAN